MNKTQAIRTMLVGQISWYNEIDCQWKIFTKQYSQLPEHRLIELKIKYLSQLLCLIEI